MIYQLFVILQLAKRTRRCLLWIIHISAK